MEQKKKRFRNQNKCSQKCCEALEKKGSHLPDFLHWQPWAKWHFDQNTGPREYELKILEQTYGMQTY